MNHSTKSFVELGMCKHGPFLLTPSRACCSHSAFGNYARIQSTGILKLLGFHHCDVVPLDTSSWNSTSLQFSNAIYSIFEKEATKCEGKYLLYDLFSFLTKEFCTKCKYNLLG